MLLDAALLNIQHYKVGIKGKVKQSREWCSALPYHLGVVAIQKGSFGSSSTKVPTFYYIYMYTHNKLFSNSLCIYVWVYIYIYIHCLYIYIYIYIQKINYSEKISKTSIPDWHKFLTREYIYKYIYIVTFKKFTIHRNRLLKTSKDSLLDLVPRN